ncbi:hypothetical protein WN944_014495 [Citrus x changshan-huyou]|uniref:Uncharacterized protein n=1 Tax=Citrus x changshan-huyou TaxID=2935761 RepID=A0AAP0M5S6_9ROSI
MSLIEHFSLLNLSSTITVLDLSGTGYLPESNWSTPLRELVLSHSDFTASIGNLTKATKIVLRSNQFTGQLPYHSPNSLEEVHLEENQIHGTILSSLFQLVNLTDLNLSSNDLSGTVRYDLLPELKNLRYLDLSNNRQLSFISSSNVNIRYPLPSPWKLRFSYCNITEFPGWKSLTDLDISNNFLTQIEQRPWKYITVLNLRNNTIQGTILVPPPSTRAFLFSNNKLFGQIPPSIPSLSSLEYLSLSHNNLSGTIPPCLGNFSTQLTILHLNNNFQGRIPDAFANGSCSLRSLDLNSNKLEGPFPRYLADCDELEVVNVGNNMIALRIIDLSHNEFTGFLPRWIFVSLEAMKNVDEKASDGLYMQGEEDYYQDSITVTVKGRDVVLKRIITIFTTIDMSSNQFQGEIPQVLGDFKSLIVLNLSHNGLTGSIPVSFANMTALESLDLSSNQLHGRIPEQLLSVIALALLNLSYNRLWGRIPRGNQFNTFENDSYIGNIRLCGEPWTVTCINDAKNASFGFY